MKFYLIFITHITNFYKSLEKYISNRWMALTSFDATKRNLSNNNTSQMIAIKKQNNFQHFDS